MIEPRNLHFAMAPVPRHWHGGHRSITTFFDTLSVFFPVGERFFVSSVRNLRASLNDAVLAESIRAFNAQEGAHSREHARYNDHLREHGYPVDRLEARTARLLDFAARRFPARMQLAVTCALEHYTALLAQLVLEDPRVLAGADPTMAALWRWHAAEELEHKSVAFDAFIAAGGTYAQRIAGMTVAGAFFWSLLVVHQAAMMKLDGTHTNAREWGSLVRFLFVQPGGLQRLVLPALRYHWPGFHPRDLGTDALLADWMREFANGSQYRDAMQPGANGCKSAS